MKLKLIKDSSRSHPGYGAGPGQEIIQEYECPCGKGTVLYEKDEIPGFREKSILCFCKECNEKYTFGQGTAELKE